MVVLCKPKLSGCRRGSVRNPGDPNRLSKLRRSPCCASRQHTSGCHGNQPSWHVRQGQQSSDWSGFGSGQEDREDIARPAAPPSAVPLPSFAATALLLLSELHDMLVAAVAPSTKVVADLFPLPLRAIPRGAKRPAPAPLRCAPPAVWPGLGQLQGDHHCNANKEKSNDHELHQIHQRRL